MFDRFEKKVKNEIKKKIYNSKKKKKKIYKILKCNYLIYKFIYPYIY